ncbi:MAG: phosphotransferase enzyme family protein [Acidimicrobiales bacterium]
MNHRVHGMGLAPARPDWAPLVEGELRGPLAQLGLTGGPVRVLWHSPRPMSAGARVLVGAEQLFVKRHSRRVRSPARLEVEHRFGDHLRAHGVRTPACRRGLDGRSVATAGPYCYEVFALAGGEDLYRDVPSWYPYQTPEHARRAGRALAHLHRAAASFAEPASDPDVLLDDVGLVSAPDLGDALAALLEARPGLARALAGYRLGADMARVLAEPVARAHAATSALARQWTHGDWHPSNLTWDPLTGDVVSVLDLGLANRTFALHDLAVALERSVIDWLDVSGRGAIEVDVASLDALLAGYGEIIAWSAEDRAALAATLPVAHVEFALSEVEYFGDVVGDATNRDLAYHGYLLGHTGFFATAVGTDLLARVRGSR